MYDHESHNRLHNATIPARKSRGVQVVQPKTANPQNAQRSYESYLELARAEMLRGNQIAAENYLQHAEHYLRSIREQAISFQALSSSELDPPIVR